MSICLPKIVIALVITGCFFASAQQPAKKSTGSTSDAEARRHYKIALAALQNNDLETAEDELKKAAQLTPRNALIYYNLAVVAEKRGDVHAADESLTKAQQLHLPADVKDQADTLRGEIDYKLQQEAKEAAVQQKAKKRLDAINWVFGEWLGEPGDHSEELWLKGLMIVNSVGSNSVSGDNYPFILTVSGYWDIHFVQHFDTPPFPSCHMVYDITQVVVYSPAHILVYGVMRENKRRGNPDIDICWPASATMSMHRNDDGSLSGPALHDTKWTH